MYGKEYFQEKLSAIFLFITKQMIFRGQCWYLKYRIHLIWHYKGCFSYGIRNMYFTKSVILHETYLKMYIYNDFFVTICLGLCTIQLKTNWLKNLLYCVGFHHCFRVILSDFSRLITLLRSYNSVPNTGIIWHKFLLSYTCLILWFTIVLTILSRQFFPNFLT